MSELVVASASALFERDLEACFAKIEALLREAREQHAGLVVLPEAVLGGYLTSLHGDDDSLGPPPALQVDGPEVARLAELAGDTVVCAGMTEATAGGVHNTAVCVSGDGVLGVHRKVHLPLAEEQTTTPGSEQVAFDTPVGRLGMLVCYDKAFPEAARTLALDGAEILCFLSAWPVSRTDPAPRVEDDRQTRQFDLWDAARAAENQVVVASSNQCGRFGTLDFLGSAKVLGPGGEVLATTGAAEGLAVAAVDPGEALARSRRSMFHLRDRRADTYRLGEPAHAG